MSVNGPLDAHGVSETPSRKKIFICRPSKSLSEEACATNILTNLAHHAYRRSVGAADIAPLMKIYAQGRKGADFRIVVESGHAGRRAGHCDRRFFAATKTSGYRGG